MDQRRIPCVAGCHSPYETPQDTRPLGTVLGVWADPDDEAYLSSGLMALSRRAGCTLLDAIGEDRFAAWWRNETFWSPGSIAP